jgi:hypothetical protein
MKVKPINAALVWKQMEDLLAPQLGFTLAEKKDVNAKQCANQAKRRWQPQRDVLVRDQARCAIFDQVKQWRLPIQGRAKRGHDLA